MSALELPGSMDLLTGSTSFENVVQSSNTAKFYPSGSTTFSDNNKNISIRLSSSDYIRPSTAQLLFTLQLSNSGQVPEDLFAVQMLGNITLEAGGRVVENVQNAGLALYPLIVHQTPASVYRSTLTASGAYKYVPKMSHFMQFAEKGQVTKTGATSVNIATRYGLPQTALWPSLNNSGGLTPNEPNAPNYSTLIPDSVLCPIIEDYSTIDLTAVQSYLKSLGTYMLSGHTSSFCKPDSRIQNSIGLDFSSIGLTVYTDPAQSSSTSFAVCANNFTNSQCVGSLIIGNSMPIHNQPNEVVKSTEWTTTPPQTNLDFAGQSGGAKLEYGRLGLGHPIQAEGKNMRTYALQLGSVLGLFSGHRLLPLRNLGSVTINIQLRPYSEMFIHTTPSNAGDWLSENSLVDMTVPNGSTPATQEYRDILTNGTLPYTISNVRVSVDTVRPADSFVAKVDAMCASNEGLSIVYTSRETSVTPVNYASNIQITSTRAYSFLKAIHLHFQESLTSQSVYLVKSDRHLGSRYLRSNTTIGSTVYPMVNCESATECFMETKKCLMKPDQFGRVPEDSVVDYDVFVGKRCTLGTSDNFASAGLFPSLRLVKEGTVEHKLRQMSQAHTQAPSCFLISQNVDRVLESGCTFSGLSTRTSGFSITSNVEFRPFDATNPAEVPGYSILNPAYLDAYTGNSSFRAVSVFEFDCLLRLANSSVEVRN